MKVRIIPEGAIYKVQRKIGPFWRDIRHRWEPHGSTVAFTFKTEEAARRWIEANHMQPE